MSEEGPGSAADPLARSLRKLTEGFGIRSATLHADLGPELRRLFHVPDWDTDALRTLARVSWHLDRLVSTQLVGDDLQRLTRISFNLGEPDVRGLKLGQRRRWLQWKKQGPSESESQRDIRLVVIPAFVASLRSQPPPRPSDRDIAALMAAKTGKPADNYLPFPIEQPSESPPPPPDRPKGSGIHITIGRLIIIVLSAVVVAAVAFVLRKEQHAAGDE